MIRESGQVKKQFQDAFNKAALVAEDVARAGGTSHIVSQFETRGGAITDIEDWK
jgi:hypothetical protein